jgi:UTP--glucose-1-phosphate uridylyltransferase
MILLHKKTKGSIIATKTVDKKTVSRWGILDLRTKKKNYFEIKNVVEKPSIKRSPSNYAIIGRYILPKIIMKKLKKLKPGQGGEIHITDAIRQLIEDGEKFYGNIFKGKYLDCGTLNGYINSTIEISKENKK